MRELRSNCVSGTYPFNRSFRLKMIALCLDPSWMARVGSSVVRPEYFEQDDEADIARAIIEYFQTYKIVPRDPDDIIVMCEGEHSELVYDIFDDRFEYETHLAADVAVQFAREQAARLAILDSVDDVKRGNIERPIQRMKDALKVGDDIQKPSINVVKDVEKWLHTLWVDKIRTGWWHVDTILEGGMAPKEMLLVMGPTNRGKSMSLVNVGFGAAGIGSAKKVVHINHEASARLVAKRYAARMVFRFPSRDEDLGVYERELLTQARKLMPGSVEILDCTGRTSIDDIRNKLDRLRSEGYDFDLVIDDYPDLVVPPRRYKDRRLELSSVYTEFLYLAADYNVPVVAATQSNRASFSKEVVTLDSIAEDIGKAQIADVVLALCQTREEEEANRCRLFMAKVRDGRNHAMVDAKYYGASQAIITTGYARKKDDDDL